MAKISDKLRKLRFDKTQQEVADALGIRQSTYASYETGRRIPKDSIKVKIARYFGVSVESIFFEEE